MSWYAVARGRVPGVYRTWTECQAQTDGYSQARFRKCATEAEARDFVQPVAGVNGVNGISGSSATATAPIVWCAMAEADFTAWSYSGFPQPGDVAPVRVVATPSADPAMLLYRQLLSDLQTFGKALPHPIVHVYTTSQPLLNLLHRWLPLWASRDFVFRRASVHQSQHVETLWKPLARAWLSQLQHNHARRVLDPRIHSHAIRLWDAVRAARTTRTACPHGPKNHLVSQATSRLAPSLTPLTPLSPPPATLRQHDAQAAFESQ